MDDYLIKWVLAERLAALTGYSVEAIRIKAKRGVWPEGVAWKLAPDGNRIFNVPAIQLWMANGVWGVKAESALATPKARDAARYNRSQSAKASGVARRDNRKPRFSEGEHRHFL